MRHHIHTLILVITLLLTSILPVKTWAAAAVDTLSSIAACGSCATKTTAAFTVGATANAGALLIAMSGNGATSITATIAGVSATLVSGSDTTTTDGSIRTLIFCAAGIGTGSQTASASWTNNVLVEMIAVTVSGVDQTTPCNNGNFVADGSFLDGGKSINMVSAAGDLTYTVAWQTNNGVTPTTNRTGIYADTSTGMDSGPGTANPTHTWSGSGVGTSVISGVNFNQAGAATTTYFPRRRVQ